MPEADEDQHDPRQRLARPVAIIVLGLIGGLVASCLGGAFLSSMASVGSQELPPEHFATSKDALFVGIVAMQLSMFAAVRYLPEKIGDLDGGDWKSRVRWRASSFSIVNVICIALGTVVAGGLVNSLLASHLPGTASQRISSVARNADESDLTVLLLLAALLPGVVEELSFRGLLQPRLVERFGPAVGIAAVAIGLWLGWCSWRESSVVNVAFAHTLNNAIFILIRSVDTGRHLGGTAVGMSQLAILLITATLLFLRTRKATT